MKNCNVSSASPAMITDLLDPEIKIAELCSMTDGKYDGALMQFTM
jgi:hypothetical protein